MEDPGDRREYREKDQQIQKRLPGFDGAHGQRAHDANADVRNHPSDAKTERHRKPAFIGYDVLHQLPRCCEPAQPIGFHDGIGWRKLTRLAVRQW